jgi:hypothetical protein
MPDSVFSPLFKSSSNIVTFKPEKYRNGNWPLSAGAEDLWRATSDGSNRSNQSHPTALAASDATPKPGVNTASAAANLFHLVTGWGQQKTP